MPVLCSFDQPHCALRTQAELACIQPEVILHGAPLGCRAELMPTPPCESSNTDMGAELCTSSAQWCGTYKTRLRRARGQPLQKATWSPTSRCPNHHASSFRDPAWNCCCMLVCSKHPQNWQPAHTTSWITAAACLQVPASYMSPQYGCLPSPKVAESPGQSPLVRLGDLRARGPAPFAASRPLPSAVRAPQAGLLKCPSVLPLYPPAPGRRCSSLHSLEWCRLHAAAASMHCASNCLTASASHLDQARSALCGTMWQLGSGIVVSIRQTSQAECPMQGSGLNTVAALKEIGEVSLSGATRCSGLLAVWLLLQALMLASLHASSLPMQLQSDCNGSRLMRGSGCR